MGRGFDGIDVGLVLLGAFYAFAGVVAARAGVMSNLLDVALTKISLKPTLPAERHRFWWLLGSAALVFMGGVALILRTELAVWLFALSATGQAIYLFALAPRYFDRVDPADAQGRSQTTNAFYIYLVATALVVLAAASGRMRSPGDLAPAEMAGGLAAVAAYVVLVARWLWPHRDSTGSD